ncbi:MAG: periplasmic nitrate reductase, NapE protein [Phyllobacterium sp.]
MARNEEQLSKALTYKPSRRTELIAFLVLAFAIWPIVAVGVVGGYGFLVWMWQILFGPPGPPSGMLH